jgi:hypothetical protein
VTQDDASEYLLDYFQPNLKSSSTVLEEKDELKIRTIWQFLFQ